MQGNINLIVIDNQENYSNVIKEYIEICNYSDKIKVIYEKNAKNALKEIAKNPNDIVILDAYTKNIDSMNFLSTMSKKDVTLVLVSDNPTNEIKNSAIEHGAKKYFPKKYDIEDLDPLFEFIVQNIKKDVIIN